MNILNQIAYVHPTQSSAIGFLEKLSSEGFSYIVISPENDFLAKISHAQPAAILIDPNFDTKTQNEIIPLIKAKLPYVPLVLVMPEPLMDAREVPLHMPVDGVCHVEMPPAHIAITLRGIIRSAFMIQELMYHNRKLNEISITDSLTGLYNRGHMMDRLNLEWKRAERNREILSCVMIDLDHFKQINDNYGHKFGDAILKATSARTKSLIRETDIFGRYGGEEFLIILPNTNLEGAAYLSEKLRAGLEEENFQQDCFSLPVTASYGVASTENNEVITADHLLQLSDRALYQAKESGRNRVCVIGVKSNEKAAVGASGEGNESKLPQINILTDAAAPSRFIKALEDSGQFAPVLFHSEADFLRAFRDQPPHMLIIDEAWPELTDTIDLCQRVKQQVQELFIPLIILLKNPDEAMRIQAVKAGVDDVIMPHIDIESFMAHVELISRLKNLHDRLRNTYKDLTMARDRLVKAERLNALGEMATGIAHDFNNILSAILGRTQLLRQRASDPSLVRSLEVIEKAASDGASTIRRIQEFSRSASSVTTSYQAVDLSQIVSDCIQLTRTLWKDQADLRGIRYNIQVNFPGRLTVYGSASDLREVIINLIINALDAMPTGGSLKFDGSVIDDNAVLVVSDTGIGMDEEIQKRVFDPFFSTKKGEGTGLGLSVAYGIIMRHNGRIEVFSEEGKGSTFRIQLPRSNSDEDDFSAPEEVEADSHRPIPQKLQILVVDDEESVREVFRDIFMQDGHVVFTASSGKEALALMNKEKVDLLFTDLSMPEMSGWELARQAKKLFPSARIVLTSGWGKDFSPEQISRHGVDFVLPKPVPFDTLQLLTRQVAEGQPISINI